MQVTAGYPTRLVTSDGPVRITAKVAVLINHETMSEAELLAAALKEYGRARLLGTQTYGGIDGWALTIPVPYNVGTLVIPYTRARTPKGIAYEGRGVAPDERVENSPADFRAGRDRVLDAAEAYLRGVSE